MQGQADDRLEGNAHLVGVLLKYRSIEGYQIKTSPVYTLSLEGVVSRVKLDDREALQ